ncbi:hypothetical protein PMIN03_000890 [Paraphaeosphaeria minitans]
MLAAAYAICKGTAQRSLTRIDQDMWHSMLPCPSSEHDGELLPSLRHSHSAQQTFQPRIEPDRHQLGLRMLP